MAETRKVGSLEVTVAGLGCNNFGMRIDEERTQGGRRRVLRRRREQLRHRRELRRREVGGVPRRARSATAASDAVITTKVAGSARPRASPAAARVDRPGHRRQPAAARHRLHRPLSPAPCPTRTRRSARRSRRSPSSSPRARCARSAARTSRPQMLEEAAAAAKELGVPQFVNVQNNYSLLDRTPEAEVIPACERLGIDAHALLPARERRAHRQVQAGRGGARGHAARGVGRSRRRDARPTSARRRRAARRVRAATTATRCPSSRSRTSPARRRSRA